MKKLWLLALCAMVGLHAADRIWPWVGSQSGCRTKTPYARFTGAADSGRTEQRNDARSWIGRRCKVDG